jgi:hypothetical protein
MNKMYDLAGGALPVGGGIPLKTAQALQATTAKRRSGRSGLSPQSALSTQSISAETTVSGTEIALFPFRIRQIQKEKPFTLQKRYTPKLPLTVSATPPTITAFTLGAL